MQDFDCPREQTFNNFVVANDFRNAFVLALSMDQPGRLLKLFHSLKISRAVGGNEASVTGDPRVDETIATLSHEDLATLLRHVRTWNASSKTSEIAQGVLHSILKLRRYGDLVRKEDGVVGGIPALSRSKVRKRPGMQDLMDSLIPYTDRHLHRLDRLLQESYVIDLIIGEMDDGLVDVDQDEMVV